MAEKIEIVVLVKDRMTPWARVVQFCLSITAIFGPPIFAWATDSAWLEAAAFLWLLLMIFVMASKHYASTMKGVSIAEARAKLDELEAGK